MSKLNEKIITHIREQAERIEFGKITITLTGNSDVDVSVEERKRFKSEVQPMPGMVVSRRPQFREG